MEAHLTGLSLDYTSCITAQLPGPDSKCKAIIALAKTRQLDKDLIRQAKTLRGHLQGPFEERNRIVHDAWYLEPVSGQVLQFRSVSHKHSARGLVSVDPDDAKQVISHLQACRQETRSLKSSLLGAL